jgi:hypothetical protein
VAGSLPHEYASSGRSCAENNFARDMWRRDASSTSAAYTTAAAGMNVVLRGGGAEEEEEEEKEGGGKCAGASVRAACSSAGSMYSPSSPASAVSVTMMWGGDGMSASGCASDSAVEYLLIIWTAVVGQRLLCSTACAMRHMGADTAELDV